MVWVFFNEKRQETQGNIMVWMFFDGKKTGNSRKYNGLGVFEWEPKTLRAAKVANDVAARPQYQQQHQTLIFPWVPCLFYKKTRL